MASDVAPYTRAIDHGVNGYLAKNAGEWIGALRALILDKELRYRMAEAGLEKLKEKYEMTKLVYQSESALLKIALGADGKGIINRPTCVTAVKQRIEQLKLEGRFTE